MINKPILRKLRSHNGETLAEVLVALLIIVLAVMLLVSMVTTSGRIDIATRNHDEDFYDELSDAEKQETPLSSGAQIVISGEGIEDITIPVDLYGGDNLTSYAKGGSN